MNYPVILVEHMIEGRIRVKLSHSIIDEIKLNQFFTKKEGIKLLPPKVNIRINKYLKEFILQGGFDVE